MSRSNRAGTQSKDGGECWVRWGGVLVFLLAIGAAVLIDPGCGGSGARCPGYALNEQLVLRGERGFAVLIVLVFVLVLFGQIVVRGRLPTGVSRDGFDFADTAEPTDAAVEGLRTLVGQQGDAIVKLTQATESSIEELANRLDQVSGAHATDETAGAIRMADDD